MVTLQLRDDQLHQAEKRLAGGREIPRSQGLVKDMIWTATQLAEQETDMMAGSCRIIMIVENCTARGLGQEFSLAVREGKSSRSYGTY